MLIKIKGEILFLRSFLVEIVEDHKSGSTFNVQAIKFIVPRILILTNSNTLVSRPLIPHSDCQTSLDDSPNYLNGALTFTESHAPVNNSN